ncbi:MAG TPA: TldD/PmbA family protein [Gaiellaceae bacterium]|jgi:TldD protein|nr:TldD/PmbA family protein [Gaiellaceae bacterium]
MRDVCEKAIEGALAAGADYADARGIVRREQYVSTKNGEVESASDGESEGLGVRVLVGGAWGFAGDPRLSPEGATAAAVRAVDFARASASRGHGGVELAERPAERGEWRTPVERDPIAIPLEEKIELLLRAEAAARRPDVAIVEASARAMREERAFRSSDGADLLQEFVECGAGLDAYAQADGRVQIRSYPSAHGGSSGQAGWEYVESLGLEREAPRVSEQAVALLQADPCPAATTTVVIDAEQMELQVHESVGHPTELDRVYGTEAAYAGTSFLKADDLGSLRYGSELMNITADPTTPGGLGTYAWDDEGVPGERHAAVRAGILEGFLTSRETAARLGEGSGGSMRADGWSRMPLVRMTNLHLEPGEGSFEDLLADVDEGIYLETNKSWSIDDKRLNFQFGTQIAWEIKDGKLGRMLRDATYMGSTPVFWGSLDAVAGPEEWRLHGLTNCGKGQPGQSAHVSHGTSPARFRNVRVGVRS